MQNTVAPQGIAELAGQSGIVVKLVLALLVAASILCWGVVFSKFLELKQALKLNTQFLDLFWNAKNLEEIFVKIEKSSQAPIPNLFRSAYRELKKLPLGEKSSQPNLEIENIERALSKTSQSEVDGLEKNLNWLATTASAAPFVGLFGTVWGIMNSFQGIGATGSANLAIVAPGISEALIATAVGLATAIPAVVFYNLFLNRIKKITVEMDGFSNDLLNIVQRSLLGGRKRLQDAE